MRFIINLILQGVLVYVTAYLLSGVSIGSYIDALLVALVLTIANAFVKPILIIFTLPITIMTLGLFLFIINGLVVLLVDVLLQGFYVADLIWAILFSIILSIFNYVFIKHYK